MAISGVSEQAAGSAARAAAGDSSLGRDAFLKIFLTQLQQQDPLAPQDATEMSAQLAQFSQLEQSLQMTEELVGIREAIAELAAKTGGGVGRGAEALALLGRTVELEGDAFAVADGGEGGGLFVGVPGAAQQIVLTLRDANGNPRAVGELRAGRAGAPAVLAAGAWELVADAGGARLRSASGTEYALPLVALARDATGKLVPAVDGAGEPIAFALDAGSYRVGAGALSLAGEELAVTTTTSGVVRAVRELGADPLLTVNQQEIALSSVIRVR
jgi:flagellar basal-body rod modification protein FlgD